MPMLKILAVALGLTLGSLAVATLLTLLAWQIATRLHHPRWSWVLLLSGIGGAWLTSLGHSEFFKLAAVFGLVASGLLYFVSASAESDERPKEDLDRSITSRRSA